MARSKSDQWYRGWATAPAVQAVIAGESDSLALDEVVWRSSTGEWRDFRELGKIPEGLRQLTGLRSLTIGSSNRESFTLPAWLDDMPALEEIDARHVSIKDLPTLSSVRWALNAETLWRCRGTVDPEKVYGLFVRSQTSLDVLESLFQNPVYSPLSLSELIIYSEKGLRGNTSEWLAQHIDEILESQDQLQELYIFGCPIGWVPPAIRKLTKLTRLMLANISLSSVPDWLFDLPVLESLNLSSNELSDLPFAVGRSQHLRQLRLGDNSFTHIPAGVWDLQGLTLLDISGSPIKSIPSDILRLRDAQRVSYRE